MRSLNRRFRELCAMGRLPPAKFIIANPSTSSRRRHKCTHKAAENGEKFVRSRNTLFVHTISIEMRTFLLFFVHSTARVKTRTYFYFTFGNSLWIFVCDPSPDSTTAPKVFSHSAWTIGLAWKRRLCQSVQFSIGKANRTPEASPP